MTRHIRSTSRQCPWTATVLAVLGLAVSLSACSSATNAANPTTGAVSVTDFSNSVITVQHPVSRVACVTSSCVGMVLGLEPVAIDGDSGKDIASNPRVFGPERTKSFSVIRGSFSSPNIEDIIAAKPELAIGNVRTHSKVRDAIASVAPMYLIATAAYPDTFRQLMDLGKLTGREAQAAATIQRFKDKLVATKARSPGNLVALLVYGEPDSPGGFAINTDTSTAGSVVAEITKYPWNAPPGVQDNGPGSYLYSLDQVLAVDPDVIIYEQFGSDDKPADKVVNNPVYRQLKAVRNNRVMSIDATYPETAQDTLGMEIFLDRVASVLYPDVFPSS